MPPTKQINLQSSCPCGSASTLMNCCMPYISGEKNAPTAESLMRSRYTAHVLLNIDYLWNTWSANERTRSSKADILEWASSCEWLGLKITETQAGGIQDHQGLVTFTAIFRLNNQMQSHNEISLFKKSLGRWFYIGHYGEHEALI